MWHFPNVTLSQLAIIEHREILRYANAKSHVSPAKTRDQQMTNALMDSNGGESRRTVITVSLIANLLRYILHESDMPAVFEIFTYDHHQRSLVKTERAQPGLDL